jgi:hypothetical protein
MGKPTNEFMLFEWLKEKVSRGINQVASHEIQLDFPRYAQVYWGATLLPDTAPRLWRKVRETSSYKNIGIDRVVEKQTESKEKHWALLKN